MAFLRKAGGILGRSFSNLSKPSIFQAVRLMSSSKVFIGGLSWSTDESSLREAFNNYGEVLDAKVIVDRETGRSKGFGFITYASVEEASASIQAMDQKDLHGRQVRVDYANDRARGYGGGGGYNNYGSGGGGGGNYGSGGGGYNNSNGYGNNGGYDGGSDYNNSRYGSENASSNNGYEGGNVNYGGDQQGFGNAGGGAGGDTYFSGGGAGGSGYDGFGDNTNNNVAGGDGRFGEDDSYAADRRN